MQIFVYKSPISTQLLFISTTVLKKSSMKMHRKLHFLCSIIWITCIQSCVNLILLNILHYTCNFIFFNYFIYNYSSSWCSITSETIIKIVIVTRCTVDYKDTVSHTHTLIKCTNITSFKFNGRFFFVYFFENCATHIW